MSVAIEEGLCPAGKMKVLGGGSGNGVDATVRFRPVAEPARAAARAALGVPPDALVVGFVGRLVPDKGVVELATAWAALRERHPRLHLLLVGPVERERGVDTLPPELLGRLENDARVHLTGMVRDTSSLYPAMDVVALPTYREGLPNVALETAAMALPIVATAIPGCLDAVQDGITGTLVAPRDPAALEAALERYITDPALRALHGQSARRWVLSEFRREAIWEAVAAEYQRLLAAGVAETRNRT
jgi:glycosyltransferase involved in cell wall biosynthesis